MDNDFRLFADSHGSEFEIATLDGERESNQTILIKFSGSEKYFSYDIDLIKESCEMIKGMLLSDTTIQKIDFDLMHPNMVTKPIFDDIITIYKYGRINELCLPNDINLAKQTLQYYILISTAAAYLACNLDICKSVAKMVSEILKLLSIKELEDL